MRALRVLALRWPLLASVTLSALSLGLLWAGTKFASRILPRSDFAETVARLPVLFFVLGLLWAGRWWRAAGFRRPCRRDLRHSWPLAILILYLLTLATWRVPHGWLASGTEQVVVAIWEESLFRGVILFLLARRGAKLALFGSAALFIVIHGFNIVQAWPHGIVAWILAWPFALGLVLAWARMRSGNIWVPIVAHFLINVLNDISPPPLTWSGVMIYLVPVELALFAILFLSFGLRSIASCRRAARLTAATATLGIAGLCATGLLFLDGPRPRFDTPVLNASLSVDAKPDGDAWSYGYRLRFEDSGFEIVSFSLRVLGNPDVQELRAVAGDTSWKGAREGNRLVWEGGVAPETTYHFRSAFPPGGAASFKLLYRDRKGRAHEWAGRLAKAPLR